MLRRTAPPTANREGLRHLAFEVDDVEEKARDVFRHGGRLLGQVSSTSVDDMGFLTFAYATDPEGNVIELLRWDRG
jgi:glyoxylase I family protein